VSLDDISQPVSFDIIGQSVFSLESIGQSVCDLTLSAIRSVIWQYPCVRPSHYNTGQSVCHLTVAVSRRVTLHFRSLHV
jgi:hypothetical protein